MCPSFRWNSNTCLKKCINLVSFTLSLAPIHSSTHATNSGISSFFFSFLINNAFQSTKGCTTLQGVVLLCTSSTDSSMWKRKQLPILFLTISKSDPFTTEHSNPLFWDLGIFWCRQRALCVLFRVGKCFEVWQNSQTLNWTEEAPCFCGSLCAHWIITQVYLCIIGQMNLRLMHVI